MRRLLLQRMGGTLKAIAQELEARGARPTVGRDRWDAKQVRVARGLAFAAVCFLLSRTEQGQLVTKGQGAAVLYLLLVAVDLGSALESNHLRVSTRRRSRAGSPSLASAISVKSSAML